MAGATSDPATAGPAGWHVVESGDPASPAVVFLHGAGLGGQMWAEHMARLTSFHCLAPDLPGCGRSNRLPWTSRDDVASGVAQLIETRVRRGRAHVVGISLGGAVAHTLVARRPGLVDRVVIDGAGVLPSLGTWPFLLGIAVIAPFLHTSPIIAALSRSVGQMPSAVQAELRVASRRAFLSSYADALRTKASAAEVEATCPMLLAAGERERAVRRSNAALAALMPATVARFVPGLGHGWLGTELELHVDMVEAWLAGGDLPSALVAERSWPGAEAHLRREIEER